VEKLKIVVAILLFGILVLVHEFGHFIVAKKCGIVVNEFSIGMGPRLCSFVKGETRYSIKLLPLGGSCAMQGEDDSNEEEGSFNTKPVWARMAVVFAGPLFNFILAFIFSIILIGARGQDVATVYSLEENSPAYEAGLREGDRIIKFNGEEALLARQIAMEEYLNPLDGSTLEIVYERDGKEYTIEYIPEVQTQYMVGMTYSATDDPAEITVSLDGAMADAGAISGDIVKSINGQEIASGAKMSEYLDANPFDGSEVEFGIQRNNKEIKIKMTPRMTDHYEKGFIVDPFAKKQSALDTIKYSFVEVKYEVAMVVKSLKMLVTGQVGANQMSGPVGIVDAIGDQYEAAVEVSVMDAIFTMISFAILLSANLGVMNLLPIPALDGGRLLFLIIEAIRRKPMDRDKEGIVHFIGFILLMILMVFLFYNDIRKFF